MYNYSRYYTSSKLLSHCLFKSGDSFDYKLSNFFSLSSQRKKNGNNADEF